MDDDRVLQFRNDVEALILSATGRDPNKVAWLARKAGITDPPENHDVGVRVNLIVFEKARTAKKFQDLLNYLPEVCGSLEKDKSDKCAQLLAELNQVFPEVRQAAGESAEPVDSADEADGLFNAAIDLVRRAKDLKLKFHSLLSGQELTRVDVEEISDNLSESASGIEELLRAYPIGTKPAISTRRLLVSLGRI